MRFQELPPMAITIARVVRARWDVKGEVGGCHNFLELDDGRRQTRTSRRNPLFLLLDAPSACTIARPSLNLLLRPSAEPHHVVRWPDADDYRPEGRFVTPPPPDRCNCCYPRCSNTSLTISLRRNRYLPGQGPDRLQHQCLSSCATDHKIDSRSLWR